MKNETQFADHLLSTVDDLYIVRAGDAADAPLKIGRAKNVVQRVRELQVGNHEPLRLWVHLRGRGHEEKEWHATFAAQRRRGEWFDWAPEIFTAVLFARWGEPWREQVEAERAQA